MLVIGKLLLALTKMISHYINLMPKIIQLRTLQLVCTWLSPEKPLFSKFQVDTLKQLSQVQIHVERVGAVMQKYHIGDKKTFAVNAFSITS